MVYGTWPPLYFGVIKFRLLTVVIHTILQVTAQSLKKVTCLHSPTQESNKSPWDESHHMVCEFKSKGTPQKKSLTRSYGVFWDIPSPVRRLGPVWPMISLTYSFHAGGPNSHFVPRDPVVVQQNCQAGDVLPRAQA